VYKLAKDFESKVFNSASSREGYVKRICDRLKALKGLQAAPTQRLENEDDCVFVRETTLQDRNEEGFANAIDVSDAQKAEFIHWNERKT
jgi:hypothetical protein